jgi:hypothetical protein
MTDYKQLCAELVDAIDSGIPTQRMHLSPVMIHARVALAEPEPEGPTDAELLELAEEWPCTTGERHDLSGCPEVPLFSVFEDELIEFAHAVLARWGK